MANNQDRSRRPPKMYLVMTEYKANDQLEGAIRILQGSLCQRQEEALEMRPQVVAAQKRNRSEQVWVKVLDSGHVLKVGKGALTEISEDLASLLQPVSDLQERLALSSNPARLLRLGNLHLGAGLRVQLHQSREKAPGVLRYVGPLPGGSSGVHFGVELQGWAVGHGFTNGSYKGHQLFQCPENGGVFVPVSRLERSGGEAEVLSRGADCSITPGNRVYFHMENTEQHGNVAFCGVLPTKEELGVFVGIRLDNAVGSWDGYFKGTQLCNFPSPNYGILLPISKVVKVISERSQNTRLHRKSHRDHSPEIESGSTKWYVGKKEHPTKKEASERTGRSGDYSGPSEDPSRVPRTVPVRHHLPEPLRLDENTQASPPVPQTSQSSPSHTHMSRPDHQGKQSEWEGPGLEVNSMVQVNDPPLYGVIRWIGKITGYPDPIAGLELDDFLPAGTDGTYLGERYFHCTPNKGLFVKLKNCRSDSRFPAHQFPANQIQRCNSIAFAEWTSEVVEDHTPPTFGEEAKERFIGWKRGIQGNCNSCYLDATLFCLFSFSSVLDTVLLRPKGKNDGELYRETRALLRSEIVNPLRKHGYVCATKIMALRKILEAAGKSSGFTSEEKDPEEFLNKLFQVLKVEPLLKIRSGGQKPQDCYFYQLFPERETRVRIPSVQQLLEWSFVHSDLKFSEAPSCLIIQMPRFGKDYKMFSAILPSLQLDITDLLDNTPRECSLCQGLALLECKECYEETDITPGRIKQFCATCSKQVHRHRQRLSHSPQRVRAPEGEWPVGGEESRAMPRETLDLYAVLCIETSHYVSFVKYGEKVTDWLFFDSMADREGGENGFNIPQVSPCPEVAPFLQMSALQLRDFDSKSIQGCARRLLCDAYMCLYHSPSLSLYK
ncbi:ubiquitin carboxyl-terminal hydrolase CYLD [Acipenser ruthenus]|uniref:ubiquitin carboxyl-terminal hydrolase CYLD n=1 Tax=Acipenser ruthenus TaxID=7906 RepID=UPI0027407812|nr:ubiquitin carboxyl-terminal hydrolase CYLD [Acipenser ruthenus]XP_058868449.1 ubiquitin carboxyl-terminal hydrolase CYLD [Acipenser ruthenus]